MSWQLPRRRTMTSMATMLSTMVMMMEITMRKATNSCCAPNIKSKKSQNKMRNVKVQRCRAEHQNVDNKKQSKSIKSNKWNNNTATQFLTSKQYLKTLPKSSWTSVQKPKVSIFLLCSYLSCTLYLIHRRDREYRRRRNLVRHDFNCSSPPQFTRFALLAMSWKRLELFARRFFGESNSTNFPSSRTRILIDRLDWLIG